MRTLTILLFICVCFTARSQDRDYPDYRSKKETFLRMQEKDIRADLASFTMGGMDESIGKGKLFSLPATNYGTDFITFSGNDMEVTIKAGVFDPSKHKMQLFNKEHVVKIDGKPYYGNYGEIPKTTIASVTMLIGKDSVAIPPAAYADLYE